MSRQQNNNISRFILTVPAAVTGIVMVDRGENIWLRVREPDLWLLESPALRRAVVDTSDRVHRNLATFAAIQTGM